MLVIKDVDVIEVDLDDYHRIHRFDYSDHSWIDKGHFIDTVTTEYILGRRFVNQRGETVVMGCSKRVQETIGLVFEVFENQKRDNNVRLHQARSDSIAFAGRAAVLETKVKSLSKRLGNVRHAPWYKRLKWVFTGVEYKEPHFKEGQEYKVTIETVNDEEVKNGRD
jgi:hypothetical protein